MAMAVVEVVVKAVSVGSHARMKMAEFVHFLGRWPTSRVVDVGGGDVCRSALQQQRVRLGSDSRW